MLTVGEIPQNDDHQDNKTSKNVGNIKIIGKVKQMVERFENCEENVRKSARKKTNSTSTPRKSSKTASNQEFTPPRVKKGGGSVTKKTNIS